MNFSQCEIMILGDLRNIEIELLGAPLTDSGISPAIQSKLTKLKLIVSGMKSMNSHRAYFLLRNSLSIPMLTFSLQILHV